MVASRPADAHDTDGGKSGDPKRRKIRKGTHSCWACKRRKEKCVPPPAGDSIICAGCLRRGTKCISQEFSENAPWSHSLQFSPGSASLTCGVAKSPSRQLENVSRELDPLVKLSQTLHTALPSRQECELIYAASCRHSTIFNGRTMMMPSDALAEDNLASSSPSLDLPHARSHPVLIAKHLLCLAGLLQDLHPSVRDELCGLSKSPRSMTRRMAETAISLVSSQNELLASVEGIECIILESVYYGNCGKLQLCWMACRRAMLLAQLMGFHSPNTRQQYRVLDSRTKANPQHIWYRIVHYDRYMCLLLGLAQGSSDRSMAAATVLANETAMGRLERLHCVIAAGVLERNESDPSTHDFSLTQDMDKDLQRAAKSLPSKWWLCPDLKNSGQDRAKRFYDTQRLYVQVFHFNLLNQLHVPYLLLSTSDRKHEYSKFACVNASREILTRFVVLRSSGQLAYNCRTIDYLAVMAAMTLLLAHLNSYRHPSQIDLMAHLYLSDRAMMEQAQENMYEMSRLNDDTLSAQSAELLQRLLAIEAEAADGHTARACSIRVQTQGSDLGPFQSENEGESNARVHIPYFGVIKFALEEIGAQASRLQSQQAEANVRPLGSQHDKASSCSDRASSTLGLVNSDTSPSPCVTDNGTPEISEQATNDEAWDPKFDQGTFYDSLLPGLIGNDWTLEGVDMAYFNNLMSSIENDGRTV